MFIKIYEENPDQRRMQTVIDILQRGGIIIFPTDTIYAIGCALNQPKAIDKVAKLKGLKPTEANLSLVCQDLSNLSEFCKPISNGTFKLMKKNLPGPFTFILDANHNVPKLFKNRKKTIGIRVPDNNIIQEIVRQLGCPIVTTSIHDTDKVIEYTTDPELIYEDYEHRVDLVIDGGYGGNIPSTVIDCTDNEIEIIREGKGELIE